jgi:signal peptidase I
MEKSHKTRNPFIAAGLSLLAPGAGQIYNGQGLKGIVFFLLPFILYEIWALARLPGHFSGLLAFLIVGIGYEVFVVVEAFVRARRLKEIPLKPFNRSWIYLLLILISLGTGFIGSGFLLENIWGVSFARMPTASMETALQKDDFLMVDLRAYKNSKAERGDLVVFKYPPDPSKLFVKRVIALEGETVEIKNKEVVINGTALQEPYKTHKDKTIEQVRDNFGPITIPPGACFVLGDNRDVSADSRYWGNLPLANIKGKALYVYWAKDKKRIGLRLK